MIDDGCERRSWASGRYFMGCDESGYGCIAGDMFVSGVIFPIGFDFSRIPGLNDSKKLGERNRFAMEPLIKECALWHHTLNITPAEIDAHTSPYYLRFEAAAANCAMWAGICDTDVFMDGNVSLKLPTAASSQFLVKGDSKSVSIAAASILAKCAKDRQMIAIDKLHPEYKWVSNKGYESAPHKEAILANGLTTFHRKSYCKKYLENQCLSP